MLEACRKAGTSNLCGALAAGGVASEKAGGGGGDGEGDASQQQQQQALRSNTDANPVTPSCENIVTAVVSSSKGKQPHQHVRGKLWDMRCCCFCYCSSSPLLLLSLSCSSLLLLSSLAQNTSCKLLRFLGRYDTTCI